MQTVNRWLGSYTHRVEAYIALTEFAKSVMLRAGLPRDRVFVKPNFITDPLEGTSPRREREAQFVFVGKLVAEKGVDLLLDAWRAARLVGMCLKIIGDGPERASLQQSIGADPSLHWMGWRERSELLQEIGRSRCLVLPSRWYEGLPMVVIEAMAMGTPVIVPDHGPFPGLVSEGETGHLFHPGAVPSLAEALIKSASLTAVEQHRMEQQARRTFLEQYTPEVNYSQLFAIYQQAMRRSQRLPVP
jgi:glycosyltransferase involved in cell wall biosynthesis